MAVQLINPIEAIFEFGDGTNIDKIAPDYSRMFIFAELVARRKQRTIITGSTNGINRGYNVFSNQTISLMGNTDDSTNNPVSSTRWTNNFGDGASSEGFGITNINVETNSSFIPRVTIEFVDIKGLAFFNLKEESPYSVLFDFPPPIYDLTLKGYYGKPLRYELHLIKTNTRFDAKTSNFIITAEFVARTFAPLTDIPFKYIDIFSRVNRETKPSPDPAANPNDTPVEDPEKPNSNISFEPRSTSELIDKIKQVYITISKKGLSDEDDKIIREGGTKVENATQLFNVLENFAERIDEDNNNKRIYRYNEEQKSDDGGATVTKLDKVTTFDAFINKDQNDGVKKNDGDRLILAIEIAKKNENTNSYIAPGLIPEVSVNPDVQERSDRVNLTGQANRKTTIKGKLRTRFIPYLKRSIQNSNTINYTNDFTISEYPINEGSETEVETVGIDVTDLYLSVKEFIKNQNAQIEVAEKRRNLVIDNAVNEILGNFRPTIYNVFKIICDDIDLFFNKMGNVVNDSIDHHNNIVNRSLIVNNQDFVGKIGAFPLYTKEQIVNNATTKTREVPLDISEKTIGAGGGPFPELTLVDDFIDVFITREKEGLVNNLITQRDGNDNAIWIPLSPIDSRFARISTQSPYTRIEQQYTSANPNVTQQIFNKILERYYVVSQHVYGNTFYNNEERLFGDDRKNKELIEFVAGAEAANIANSFISSNNINNIKYFSDKFGSNDIDSPDGFYSSINDIFLYDNLADENYLFLGVNVNPIENIDFTDTDEFSTVKTITNKIDDTLYSGIKIVDSDIKLRLENSGSESEDPVDKYMSQNLGFWNGLFEDEAFTQFSSDNILFIKDDDDGNTYESSFYGISGGHVGLWSEFLATLALKTDTGGTLQEQFLSYASGATANLQSKEAKALTFFIAGLFGEINTPFNGFRSTNVASQSKFMRKFLTPAIIECPRYFIVYLAGLIQMEQEELDGDLEQFAAEVEYLYNKFYVDAGTVNNIEGPDPDLGQIILEKITENLSQDRAGISRLSKKDRYELQSYFNVFKNNNLVPIVNAINDIFNEELEYDTTNRYQTTWLNIKNVIEPRVEESFNVKRLVESLNDNINLLNYNELTFNQNFPITGNTFQTLAESNNDPVKKQTNDIFFRALFKELRRQIEDRAETINNVDKNIREGVRDNNVRNQLYYSFKNISDKWVAISNDGEARVDSSKGFPTNSSGTGLISQFSFVDRANNPIGNQVILNLEPLVEISKDYDASVFTVLSRLLSINNFEFFPLQNLMSFKNDEWQNSFKIDSSLRLSQEAHPSFVCMYIGGTSKYLNNYTGGFDDDGIIDIEGPDLKDFNVNTVDDDVEIANNPNQQYSTTRAFRVRFGAPNQSVFTNIQLDSKEYPETNESLQILSQIASDGATSAPIPKGQNLFNLYETRSYTAKIEMLGNMMIQPTQYFQLENVPMYSGAYLILTVKHQIRDNFMMTSFEGVRVLKYPNPLVTDFLATLGISDASVIVNQNSGESYEDALERLDKLGIKEQAIKESFKSLNSTPENLGSLSQHNQNKLLSLHPVTRQDFTSFIKEANDYLRGINSKYSMYITSGYRSFEKQSELWAKRESNPFPVAEPGSSRHNDGLAIDTVIEMNGEPFKTIKLPTELVSAGIADGWTEIVAIAKKYGILWGGTFNTADYVHFYQTYGVSNEVLLKRVLNGEAFGDYPAFTLEELGVTPTDEPNPEE